MRGVDLTHQAEWSDVQRIAVLDEMNCILADPAFKSSKRCVTLLRRLIEHVLAGDHDGIKERTLGVEVFGRNTSYDTSTDPIVRMTANEIRKRLAQWYQESDRHHTVKIRLVAGSYLPEFDFDLQDQQHADAGETKNSEEPPDPAKPNMQGVALAERGRVSNPAISRRKWILWSAAILVMIAGTDVLVGSGIFRSSEYLVWKPLLKSGQPLTMCVTDDASLVSGNERASTQSQIIANVIASREAPPAANSPNLAPTIPLVDAGVANRITAWMSDHGTPTTMRTSSALTLRDFRQGPAVIIGAFSNPWSLILLSNLRYSVRVDPVTHDKWIQDAQNPSKREWTLDGKLESSNVDYGLVTRFLDRETGNWIIAVGGLRPLGTEAAGELLTDPSLAQTLPASVRSAKNFQLVVRTNIISGNPGPPQILAVYTW